MLELESVIAERIRAVPALAGWSVREGSKDLDRSAVPAVDVRLDGLQAPQASRPAVTLQPEWQVMVVIKRGEVAAQQLGTALPALVQALHNWRPSDPTGRQWTELQLGAVRPVDFADAGLMGYALVLTTASVFYGQP